MQNNDNLKHRANNRKLPTVLEPEEVAGLLSIPNKRFLSGLRNKAMLRLMLSMGLRVSEVVNLRPSDINLTLRKLRIVNGKGGVDRDIIIPEFIIDLVKEWKNRKPIDTNYFFTTNSGGKLSRIYIYNMVKGYTRRAGIDKKISPHTLRHTFGTNFYRQMKDIETLRKILGHAHISTTQIYVTLANIDVEMAMNGFKDYTQV
ncbi:MAG: tyrosine-type recombinase/integrase [Actinobacteria bacterium]|nr:tyrosine-type recombinase/integrase [Actinomycetota bacterium]